MTRAIGEPLTAEESMAMVQAARALLPLRIRFRHRGRNPQVGLDCAGMVGWLLQSIGRSYIDLQAYGREPHNDGLREALRLNLGDPLPASEAQPGDIPLIRFDGAPRHVGLITRLPDGRLGLIHIHAAMKHIAEHGLAGYEGEIVEVYRP